MNGAFASEDRLKLTSVSLNSTMDLLKSVRKLRHHTRNTKGKYGASTLADADRIFAFIKDRLPAVISEIPPEVEYDRSFWYDEGENEGTYMEEPSHRAEVGYDDIYTWFLRNQVFLTTVKEKLVVTEDPEDSDEEEREDSDSDSSEDDE